ELKTSDTPASIVLVLAAQCHFCQESATFYQHLSSARQERHYTLVAVFGDAESGTQFLRDHQITVDQLIGASPRSIGAAGRPTVVVINRSGEVQGAWVGRLSRADEDRVLDTAQRLSSPSGAGKPLT